MKTKNVTKCYFLQWTPLSKLRLSTLTCSCYSIF